MRKDIGRYIFRDPELGPALHKLRSGGKKLFLLTNSLWDYTDVVMSFLLDGVVTEYPSWRNYFDVVITGAAKPAFFTEGRPFLEVDASTRENTVLGEAKALERWKVYQGGNLPALERMTGIGGEKVLYVGDHIYGDILRSRKASLWRTCMVVQELEDEIRYTEGRGEEIARLGEVELLIARLDDELNVRKGMLNALDRRLDRDGGEDDERAALEEERRRAKSELERLRRALRSEHRHRRRAGARRGAGVQPLLGPDVQGGEREQPLRLAGGAVRVPVHVAGEQLPLPVADAVPPRAAGSDAARVGRARRRDGSPRSGARVRRRPRSGDSSHVGGRQGPASGVPGGAGSKDPRSRVGIDQGMNTNG